jgi:O-methyltransferase
MSRVTKYLIRVAKEKSLITTTYYLLTVPVSIIFILHSQKIHSSYRMSGLRKLRLGITMFLNTLRIPTGTSYKTHLAMALKILETPPHIPGDIVECGTWKGGAAANLSLVCKIVGRRLKIFDSFQGLPEGDVNDREAKNYLAGDYSGTLHEVQANIKRYGSIENCDFIEGWFNETLPMLDTPVLLAFVDVDLEGSLTTCIKYLWPRLSDSGFIFIDEAVGTDYCALFYSEKWWMKNFNITPPGLIGAGVGLALGEYYVGPWSETDDHPYQHHTAGAYTAKGLSGYWSYYPEEVN